MFSQGYSFFDMLCLLSRCFIYIMEDFMKKIIMLSIWFLVLSLSFAFVGGLINGLSGGGTLNSTLAMSFVIILAFAVSILGVYKELLPGAKC